LTGGPGAVVAGLAELVATMRNVVAQRGCHPGLKRLEAILDQSVDEATSNMETRAAEVAATGRPGTTGASRQELLHRLEAVNEALRSRLPVERARFGDRAALLEGAAHTAVESAIKAVHGRDVIARCRLEEAEKVIRRWQEETADQQIEPRAIYANRTMQAVVPVRQLDARL
jgi:hypothetical protein